MKYSRMLPGLAALVLFCAARATACDCAFLTVCQDYSLSSTVFLGTVIHDQTGLTVTEQGITFGKRVVRLSVDEPFRGVEGGQVEVLTRLGGADCGFRFEQTRQYLVFANKSDSDGKLYTSSCHRTQLASDAENDLAYIRGLNNARHGAMISGEALKYLRNQQGELANQPMSGLRVIIDGPDKIETLTNANGRYRVEGLKAGEYKLRVISPPGLNDRQTERTARVSERGCDQVSFWLEPDTQLSGRILDLKGRPMPRAEIFLVEGGKERYRGHWDAASADEEGKYSFKGILPGQYVLVIRFDGLSNQNRPFPLVYYPGVRNVDEAQVFTITEGSKIPDADLTMPPLPLEYEVSGTVMSPDGRPVPDASVEYRIVQDVITYRTNADAQGQFSFKAYDGMTISIRAAVKQQDKTLYGNWVEARVNRDLSPVTIIFTGQ